jgi:hypothetical protein
MRLYFLINFVYSELFTIKSPGKMVLALTITENSGGFTKYDPTSQDQKLEMVDNSIGRNNKKICSSSNSSEVRLCISKDPINADFEPIYLNNSVKFKTRGNHVLAVGDYNVNTEMYDIVILEENKASINKFFFSIDSRDEDSLLKPYVTSKTNKK